jgi:hypothetical protein
VRGCALWQASSDRHDSAYIHSGYRFIPIERWGALLASAFQWHNETFNIWSHALGAAALCVSVSLAWRTNWKELRLTHSIYGIICLHPSTPQAQSDYQADGLVTLGFLVAAVACMTCSAIWHTFAGCGTSSIFNGCACLDCASASARLRSRQSAELAYRRGHLGVDQRFRHYDGLLRCVVNRPSCFTTCDTRAQASTASPTSPSATSLLPSPAAPRASSSPGCRGSTSDATRVRDARP